MESSPVTYTIMICHDPYGLGDGGFFIQDYLPDQDKRGLGTLITTASEDEAKQFPTGKEALEFYRQQSKLVPIRPDGHPNRPITAYTVEVAPKGTHWKAVS